MNVARGLALVGLLIACTLPAGCDQGGTEAGAVNGLTFTFSGALSGSYTAAGTPVLAQGGELQFGSWAIAAEADSLGGLVLAAFRPAEEPRGDLFVLQISPLRAGVFTPCEPNADCHGRVLFGYEAGLFDHYFEIVSGSVTIGAIENHRLRGTFQFLARDEGGTGEQTLTVGDGEFDLPFATAAESDAVLCMIESESC
ncbi:MAG: hypothetical protein JSV86_20925 [Gemmatimonadota bacterium]|nr:MAG: hypothetical protein JSV86_20925 [Gemmatimonadota bacterium]